MGADPITYCLENITDYSVFERLCNQLMLLEGYASIVPLGGFKDKGRDAVHLSEAGLRTIFAYSVREDWRAKLAEDAEKIHRHRHQCSKLVFVTTANITAGEHDEASQSILGSFGWELELYDIKRVQLILDSNRSDILNKFPQIFPPVFFRGRHSSHSRKHLFISYTRSDRIFAQWLTDKLSQLGYTIWCEGYSSLDADPYPTDLKSAFGNDTFVFVPILSNTSVTDAEQNFTRSLALTTDGLSVIPLIYGLTESHKLDNATRAKNSIDFHDWALGLAELQRLLLEANCPRVDGSSLNLPAIALQKSVFIDKTESLYSNSFEIQALPKTILSFSAKKEIQWLDSKNWRIPWGFRKAGRNSYLSFTNPPQEVQEEYKLSLDARFKFAERESILGIDIEHLRTELIKKTVQAFCIQRGLLFCSETYNLYFPDGLLENDKLAFLDPLLGKQTFVTSYGRRKFWRPTGSEYYRYYLAPNFYLTSYSTDKQALLLRIRLRITDDSGVPLTRFKANSRRKNLCRDWWNHDWLKRVLAVSSFLSDGKEIIEIGGGDDTVRISAKPTEFTSPLALDEVSVGASGIRMSVEKGEAEYE